MKDIFLYHGGETVVAALDLSYCRPKTDFGRGFYTTMDEEMACTYVAAKDTPTISVFRLRDYENLNIRHLKLDETWLSLVLHCRGYRKVPLDIANMPDILIGPTADAHMFSTFKMYRDGIITQDQLLRCFNAMNLNEQVVFKTNRALKRLKLEKAYVLNSDEQNNYAKIHENQSAEMEKRYKKEKKKIGIERYWPSKIDFNDLEMGGFDDVELE